MNFREDTGPERNRYFTSDLHLSHANVIKYCNRPFRNADEMNEKIIENWNSVVTPQDIVYIVGDVIFEKDENKRIWLLNRLKGEKHLIKGNHDRIITGRTAKCFNHIENSGLREIKVPDLDGWGGNQVIVMCHYAMRVWNKAHYGAFHLYGHSHGTLKEDPNSRSFDVGVDSWNFTPVSYQQIKEKMAKKNWKPVDHHGEEDE